MTELTSGARSPENIAWSRWFARVWLDYVFVAVALGFVIEIVAPQSVLLKSDFAYPFVLLVGFLSIPGEAACVAKWGQTPGHWLLALRVTRADGARLTFDEAFGRATSAFIIGCGLLFPLASLFTMNAQYKRVRAGRPTSWDEKRGALMLAAPLSDARIRVLVIVVVAMLALMFF